MEPTIIAFPKWLASRTARTSPLALWNHFDWLHRVAKLPWAPSADAKPRGIRGVVVAGGGQAVPPDPEILLVIEEEAKMGAWLPEERVAGLNFARALWMACLRERHLQRSILTKLGSVFLWGVCTRGKNKPGFHWGMPRYSPIGEDLGGQLWYAWKEASLAAG